MTRGRRVGPAFTAVAAVLALVASGLAIAPAAAAEPSQHRLEAEAGAGVSPQCSRDNSHEYTHATSYGGRSVMFYPHDQCVSEHDLTSLGIAGSHQVTVTSVTFVTTGYVGTICGKFVFSGRAHGESAEVCPQNDQWVTATASTTPGSDEALLIITWRTGGGTAAWANAYLDHVDLTSTSPVEPCPTGDPDDCDPPECEDVDPALCDNPDPVAVCEAALGILLEFLDDHVDLHRLLEVNPPEELPITGPSAPSVSSPVTIDCTPCVAGDGEDCIAPYTCLAGPAPECIIVTPTGCSEACELLREVCLLFLPTGVVGNLLREHLPDKYRPVIACNGA